MAESIEITVPAANTTDILISTSTSVGRGLLTNVYLRFAGGVNGTTLIRITKDSAQLFPRTVGGFYRLQKSPIQIFDQEPLTNTASGIGIQGWSSAATYPHRIILNFDVVPFDDAELIV